VGVAVAIGALAVVGLWLWDDGLANSTGAGGPMTGAGQLSGLLGTYALVVTVVLMARVHFVERRFGLGRLAVWHRWAGFAAMVLIGVHVVTITIGYAASDGVGIAEEISDFVDHYPDVLMAIVGTFVLLVVTLTSLRSARAETRRETWYFVHLYAYLGFVLVFPHQLAVGSDFVDDTAARAAWLALFAGGVLCVLVWRVGWPLVFNYRHRLRVVDVTQDAPDVVSVHVGGLNFFALDFEAGQFYMWRVMTRDGWWQPHPFSLSAAPDGRSMRFTVKDLGDYTRGLREVAPGTKLFAEGPYGVFTVTRARERQPVALFAGGIGITPVRAMLETLDASDRDVILVWRVATPDDFVFTAEIDAFATEPGLTVHKVVSDVIGDDETDVLGTARLRELVPDLAARDVFISGPPGFVHAVRARALQIGTPAGHIHSEPFEF
jgi:predicted ferric reductase